MSGETGSLRRVGPHLVVVEKPDLVVCRCEGDILPDDTAQMIETIRSAASANGSPVYVLSDISRLGTMPAASRKTAAESRVLAHLAALAMIGGAFHQRIVATLAVTAAKLSTRERVLDVRFFATEREARAWIDEKRQKQP